MEAPFAMLLRALNNSPFHFARFDGRRRTAQKGISSWYDAIFYMITQHITGEKGLAIGKRIFEFVIHDEFGRMFNWRYFFVHHRNHNKFANSKGRRLPTGTLLSSKIHHPKVFLLNELYAKSRNFLFVVSRARRAPIQLAQWTVKIEHLPLHRHN